ncbi:MAG TPA: peroxidase family protein, partial [Pyrinomonadaceae bacterium]
MHGRRAAYYVIGEDVLSEAPPPGGQAGGAPPERVPPLKFGRLFGRTRHAPRPEDEDAIIRKLIRLGRAMSEPGGNDKGDSDIPAGYTYLGQFIAHEVTHDSTGELLAAGLNPENLNTPEIDLDSLYGGEDGPRKRPELYRKDGVHLRTRDTLYTGDFNVSFPNDLPRGAQESPEGTKTGPTRALLGDPRNDENLAVAQTHVAFIHFHNKVVDEIRGAGKAQSGAQVFALAREQVIRHYQWVILHDFLPRLVRADVLDRVMRHAPGWFKGDGEGLFMPLEFSAAAFRIGHTMVRDRYEWNPRRRSGCRHHPAPLLMDLFRQTGFLEGGLDGLHGLKSDWVIDWRHFYDFAPLPHVRPVSQRNVSRKLNTVFDL